MNLAFDAQGERTFHLMPMRTSLTPRFVTVDQEVLKELGLVGAALKSKLRADITKRRKATSEFTKQIKALKETHLEAGGSDAQRRRAHPARQEEQSA